MMFIDGSSKTELGSEAAILADFGMTMLLCGTTSYRCCSTGTALDSPLCAWFVTVWATLVNSGFLVWTFTGAQERQAAKRPPGSQGRYAKPGKGKAAVLNFEVSSGVGEALENVAGKLSKPHETCPNGQR
jgi:hypothetical protein